MPKAALLLLLGNLLLQSLGSLPPSLWLWVLVPFLLLLPSRRWRIVLWLPGGFLLAYAVAANGLLHRLPGHPERVETTLHGRVVSLPRRFADSARFRLQVIDSHPDLRLRRVELSWRNPPEPLHAGQVWRLRTRLHAPHGWRNPGGRDRELYDFAAAIDARGTVLAGALLSAGDGGFGLSRVREDLSLRIGALVEDVQARALLQALVLGDRRAMSTRQWTVLRRSGTSHLFSISGLHIGLLAGFGLLLGARLGRWFPSLQRRWPAQQIGAVVGLVLALIYALLAGFSLPTQRALIMLLSVGAGWLLRRASGPWNALAVALLAVQLVDPMAVLSPGLWLSFGAVAWLFWLFDGRRGWPALWRLQLILPLAMLPMSIAFFGQFSLLAPWANMVAIPWVSFLVVPEALLGTALMGVSTELAHGVLWLAAKSVLSLFWLLRHMSAWHGVVWSIPSVHVWAAVLAGAGLVYLLAPMAKRWRWPAVALLLPLVSTPPWSPKTGNWALVTVDVGQGLAIVLRTHAHTLLYDTGPSFSGNGDTVSATIAPLLSAAGILHLDRLIISHGDADHSGGLNSVLATIPVDDVQGSDPAHRADGSACVAGQQWDWDGVHFAYLHPNRGLPYLRNESSCVLRVSSPAGSALLAGDIGPWVERDLVARYAHGLRSDLLIVPHHGSRFSSGQAFVQAVQPRVVVVSAGWHNRFHMPDPGVKSRYRDTDAVFLDTGQLGAVTVRARQGRGLEWWSERGVQQHYWSIVVSGRSETIPGV